MVVCFSVTGHCNTGRPGKAELRSICFNALGNRTGAVVIIDVKSGDVLASVPEHEGTMTHPSGSVAKLMTAHAGIISEAVSPETFFECRNVMQIQGITYNCTLKGGHGWLNMRQAIAQSCNVWFYQAARRIGRNRIIQSWSDLGIKYDLQLITSPTERVAIGVGTPEVNCLEMARMARLIALKKDTRGSACPVLAEGMRLAVTQGTAQGLSSLKTAVAGKTGSPEHRSDPEKRHGWFMGFAPYDDPEIAFAVFCREGNSFESAVPVAKRILERYFRLESGR